MVPLEEDKEAEEEGPSPTEEKNQDDLPTAQDSKKGKKRKGPKPRGGSRAKKLRLEFTYIPL